MDPSAARRNRNNQSRSQNRTRQQTLRSCSKAFGHDFGFRIGFRLCLVRLLWEHITNWSRKRNAYCPSVDSFGIHRYFTWWNAAKGLWPRIWYFSFHCRQCVWKYLLENTQSYHPQILIRNRVWRISNRLNPSSYNKTQQNLCLIPGILPH